ncbi:MAG: GPW/gp25 family protein [Candidatus Methanoperedens sp.]|nr:GPW/gp25 family protein [Candidatus Methanoperedens sp.]MCE8427101.1 GPW/gp25 family protein [Candidatus Methanoperedens sp.]
MGINEAKDFLGTGWKYPVKVNIDGKIALSSYEEDIKEAIRIILGTAKGERVMRPDFGCGIHELVFVSINSVTMKQVEKSVREGLTQWEPRIDLKNVDVSAEKADEGKLLVSIDYIVRATNTRSNLVFPFYLNEGK